MYVNCYLYKRSQTIFAKKFFFGKFVLDEYWNQSVFSQSLEWLIRFRDLVFYDQTWPCVLIIWFFQNSMLDFKFFGHNSCVILIIAGLSNLFNLLYISCNVLEKPMACIIPIMILQYIDVYSFTFVSDY